MAIKKTMCHYTLKSVVCNRHLFFGCSGMPHTLVCGFNIPDIIKPSDCIVFADENVKEAWEKVIRNDKEFAKQLLKAKADILENSFCGIQVPKNLIPPKYIQKYGIRNLWKYNLPDAWRLLYSITTPSKVEIISVILEWMDHKDYERLFRY